MFSRSQQGMGLLNLGDEGSEGDGAMGFNVLKKLLGDSHYAFAKVRYVTHQVHHSETHRETMNSVEKLADASLRLLAEKSKHEQIEILDRMDELSKKINKALEREQSLVVTLALLTAIRVHEQLVNGTSN